MFCDGLGRNYSAGRELPARAMKAKRDRHLWAMLHSQRGGVYFGKVSNSSRGKCNHGVERGGTGDRTGSGRQFSGAGRENFPYHRDVQGGAAGSGEAERDAQRFRQQLEEREEQLVALRRQTVQLSKEREEIRGRVEKMLQQIDSIAEERAS